MMKRNKITLNGSSISIDLNHPYFLQYNKNHKIPRNLLGVATRVANSTKKHFDEDGWDLDLDFLYNDMLYQMFGFHPKDMFLSVLAKKMRNRNIKIVYNTKLNLIKQKKRCPK